MEKKLDYSIKTYEECKNELLNISQKYYGDIFYSFNDASIGNWLLDITADVYDNLMYNIDRAYQETNVDSATSRKTLLQIAKNNGVRIPGRKSAIVEVEVSCMLPLNKSYVPNSDNDLARADESYAPIIRKGTLFSSNSGQLFELSEDMDFSKQFDENGISNRKIGVVKDSNGVIKYALYKKLGIAVAGQRTITTMNIYESSIKPFMSVTLTDKEALNVESIIIKQGTDYTDSPSISDFYVDRESYEDKNGKPVQRYFEVDNLIDQYRFGYEEQEVLSPDGKSIMYNPVWESIDSIIIDDEPIPVRLAMKGKWKRLKNKFITEFTDNGMLKITFGAGIRNKYGEIPEDATLYTQYMMSRMMANDGMGVLPEPNTTMYILYRTGGGETSNIAKDTLKNIMYANIDIVGNCCDNLDSQKKAFVRNSLLVTNTTPSYGGKDAPSNEEIKYYIKYANSAQNRCVTVNDYYAKLLEIEPKYGCPFKYGIVEENNKIAIYCLGLDYNGYLTNTLSQTVANNMREYLSHYKMITDFVEIKPGNVINIGFEIDVYIDKTYDRNDVVKNIIDFVYDYMDIRKYRMGDDIFIGELEKEISKIDGVANLIQLRVYNKVGNGTNGYSKTRIPQELVDVTSCEYANEYGVEATANDSNRINLLATDKTLLGDASLMYEVKYKEKDIIVNVKVKE